MSSPPTIAETLQDAARRLREAGVPNDLLDAQTLLCFTLGRDRTWLIINYREAMAESDSEVYTQLIARRATGEPLQYITGRQEFFGLDFAVSPAVLIPRPESELIVEEVVRLGWPAPLIVDVGTGSGCLAVAIAREIPTARVIAIDIAAEALAVARQNAVSNGVAAQIEFVNGDLLGPLTTRASIIVSNPPYIAASEMDGLQREVRDWEPRGALTDEGDGLGFYRRLLRTAPAHLEPGGYLICEIGYQQAAAMRSLVESAIWDGPRFLTDLQGYERTMVVRLRQSSPASDTV
ncbi:MAG: peptide chain release factor N(5)-glutamine methyltransferase [Acidobacteriota bacterium]|jgi:release factor glutamine methyltransferase